ncbi:unnamed protein product [Durusdinium trenchii]|uniref:Mitochondrial import inner membrane translocase subunit TIM50 n=1 Tax=Durusdinium trenchii TaxID=1381693 RepID=A0ABP0N4M2_9DINO
MPIRAPRVIFLDVDGVLNSAAERSAVDYIGLTGGLWLERGLIERLRDLVHLQQAFLVISSSWRRDRSAVEDLKRVCADVGLPRWRFLGQTCELGRTAGPTAAARRGTEIRRWLSAFRAEFGVQQWITLDDMDLASAAPEHLRKHHIRTHPYYGLQPAEVQKALQVFGCGCTEKTILAMLSDVHSKGIVLDIDGTLIDSTPFCDGSSPATYVHEEHTAIYARPHLDEFLDFCFERFDGVGLWTTSDASWCHLVVDEVLGKHRDWCFFWSQQHCSERQRDREGQEIGISKKLKKLWRSSTRRARGFHRESCVIVEDTVANCYFNRGNAIIVPTFAADKDDEVLLKLMSYLDKEVLPREDVRYAEAQLDGIIELFTDPGTLAFLALWAAAYSWGSFGGKQVSLEPWERRKASWYLLNGVFFHFFCDGMAGALGLAGILGRLYPLLDRRVHARDPGACSVLFVELFVMMPLCVLTFRAIRQGKASRHALEICLCSFHIFGTVVFVLSEAFMSGCRNVPTLEPLGGTEAPHWCGKGLIWPPTENQLIYFWFGFVFANIPWLTLPLRLLLLAMQAATEEAELAGMAKNEKVKDN